MSKPSKQNIEKISVAALLVVAAAIAYIQFGPKPEKDKRPKASPVAAQGDIEIPDVPEWIADGDAMQFEKRPEYAPPPFDIFEPVAHAPAQNTAQQYGELAAATPVFALSGTMRGAEGILAVINGDIVSTGETIGKYTVGEIEDDSVTLLHPEGDIYLTPTAVPPPVGSRL